VHFHIDQLVDGGAVTQLEAGFVEHVFLSRGFVWPADEAY
jgi:hypothetical protein